MHAAFVLVALVSAGAPRGGEVPAQRGVQEQAGEAPAPSCDAAVDGMDATTIASVPQCAARKAAFCRRLATREGLAVVLDRGGDAAAEAGRLCGKDIPRIQAALCPAAAKEYAKGGPRAIEALVFLGQSCPAEARPVAVRECAGRSYTDMEGAFRDFCTAYARRALDAGGLEVTPAKATPANEEPAAAEPSPAPNPKGGLPRR